jgi:GntR family transcriptional regulator
MRLTENKQLAEGFIHRKPSPTPIYYQLQTAIQKNIQEGLWRPGDNIPPERKLAEHYQVSVGTVRQAIANLVNEGYLNRFQGKGTFVRETAFHHESLRYYPLIRDFGDPTPDLSADLLSRRVIAGFERANRLLQIEPGQKLFEIKRRILLHLQPAVYCISYLPYDMFQGLESMSDEVFSKNTLYLLIEKHFARPTIHNHELFSVASADAEVKKHLKVTKGQPLLHIEMLALTFEDQPYEYRISFCRTEAGRVLRIF